jgi:MinD superfamily P-loop ATPase
MRELVVISGKGGTGKTSLTASFAVLAGRPVLADCDVTWMPRTCTCSSLPG